MLALIVKKKTKIDFFFIYISNCHFKYFTNYFFKVYFFIKPNLSKHGIFEFLALNTVQQ